MGNPNGLRTVLLISAPLFLLLPLSVLTLILERIAYSLFYAHTDPLGRAGGWTITFYGPTYTGSNDYEYIDVNIWMSYGSMLASILLCVVGIVVGIIDFCGIWELRRIEGTPRHQRAWSWTVLVTSFAMMVGTIAVLAWESAVEARGGWKDYSDVGKGYRRYSRETWACQIDEFFPQQDWAGTACAVSKAARFILIPLAISAALVTLCGWLLVRDRGGLKWLVGGKGRYGAFDSVYEMRPQGQQNVPNDGNNNDAAAYNEAQSVYR